MPNRNPWLAAVEQLCLALFFVWLAALPLPFGSVVERARVPLIAVPISLCTVCTLLRLYAVRHRTNAAPPTRAWVIWAAGFVAMLVVAALQLVPLPPSILRTLSPGSHAIWTAASRVAELGGVHVSAAHPISIDPDATLFELFRVAALLATLTTAALLVRTPARRLVLASVLCLAAAFESLYGVREAALQRYEIWGWQNKLIFDRATGTFVNPNHFAHYLAIVLPMALFVAAAAWYRTGNRETPLRQRLLALVERQLLWTAIAAAAIIVSIAGILLAQSRGALLSLGAGILVIASCLPGRRLTRIAFATMAGLLLVGVLAFFLGAERTSLVRFLHVSGDATLGGRRIGIDSAVRLWERFPVLGTGLGTFERAVFMEQREDLGKTYHHAHDDYAEIAATSGTIGYFISIAALFGGYLALLRMTFGRTGTQLSWPRRAFQAAALASLTIAMVHALVDFNFFIPANPATLASIAGAAVASVDHDKRTRR